MRRPRVLLVIALLVLLVLGGWAVERVDKTSPVLDVVEVPVQGLSHEVTLVQASDLHGLEFGRREGLIRALLKGRRVDAAIMTGDILDCSMQPRGPAYDLAAVLASATPRLYYLPGNHDPDDLGSDLASRGVTALVPGRAVALDAADPAARQVALSYAPDSASIEAARGYGARLLVLASHTPPNATRLAAGASFPGKHLFIAGHSHGGQVRLPLIGAIAAPTTWEREEGGHPGTNETRLFPDLRGYMIDGMYERDGQRVYVATGLGWTWIPIRFLDRSALVLYRFVPAR